MSERPSPLPNRVTPFGKIVAEPWRGTLMGNRGGRMHDESRQLRRPWVNQRWIACVLEFRGRWRPVMGDGYTELFFLDEASAFAAGHRPCFQCRRPDALRFLEAWAQLSGGDPRTLRVDPIDRVLSKERLPALRGQGPGPRVEPQELPPGAFVAREGSAFLWWEGALRPWIGAGYGGRLAPRGAYELLTPPSFVRLFAAGYVPAVHRSASEPSAR